MKSNKFIIRFAYSVLLKYTWNWENITILGQKILDVRVIPAQEVNSVYVCVFETWVDLKNPRFQSHTCTLTFIFSAWAVIERNIAKFKVEQETNVASDRDWISFHLSQRPNVLGLSTFHYFPTTILIILSLETRNEKNILNSENFPPFERLEGTLLSTSVVRRWKIDDGTTKMAISIFSRCKICFQRFEWFFVKPIHKNLSTLLYYKDFLFLLF